MCEVIELPENDFKKIKVKQVRIAKECLDKLFEMIPFNKRFKVSDGREAFFKIFYKPEFNKHGELIASIDVKFPDGHIEFYIEMSGFGGDPNSPGPEIYKNNKFILDKDN